ncbi:Flp family type IVb pilin [Spongiibacter taiwanensis]|uniref:Flp family type IVb pilin n=1 Tax=Spongiibacter taiwanensis TaxID=1748242 RepID=UPI0020353B99|nr:Flp family type IVb pilin [Spongiibacter taiwanensis]USA43587.1 Flp family type IVb pilin [Spongiibacter taiwanensis]
MLNKFAKKLNRFAKDEKGASAVEYAVIAAIVIVVGLLAFNGIGGKMDTKFTSVSTSLD